MTSLGAHLIDERYPTRDRIAQDVDPSTPEYNEQYATNLAGVLYHPAGSCKMGAIGDPSAVVDPQLR